MTDIETIDEVVDEHELNREKKGPTLSKLIAESTGRRLCFGLSASARGVKVKGERC